MGFQEDYIVRVIRDMVRTVAKLLFKKQDIDYQLPAEEEYTATDFLYKRILELADAGEINEAENMLIEELHESDMNQFEMALSFYLHLNEFDNDFLDEHDFSREEIRDGIRTVSKFYGADGIVNTLI